MDKIFGEIDYVEAGEQETAADKVENHIYQEAHEQEPHSGDGGIEMSPKGAEAEHVEVKQV